jgi:hypothetical protein
MDAIIDDLAIKLRESVYELNTRGLYIAATWSSEQILGLPPSNNGSVHSFPVSSATIPSSEWNLIQFATPLLSLSEYQRCSHLFRTSSGLKPNLSHISLYIACYAMYLAGEKLKDQMDSENKSSASNSFHPSAEHEDSQPIVSIRNPYIFDSFIELLPFYETYLQEIYKPTNSSSPLSMDGFMLYIFAVIVRELRCCTNNIHFPDIRRLADLPPTETLFLQSLILNPYNWYAYMFAYMIQPLLMYICVGPAG